MKNVFYVGQTLIATDPCPTDEDDIFEDSLIVGKKYRIESITDRSIAISSEQQRVHWYTFDVVFDYFKLEEEPLRKANVMTAMQQLINYMVANFHLTDESHIEFAKAIELEKQQIIDAFNQGYRNGESDGGINKSDIANYSDAQYYYDSLPPCKLKSND
jgi:hypothetical protein